MDSVRSLVSLIFGMSRLPKKKKKKPFRGIARILEKVGQNFWTGSHTL